MTNGIVLFADGEKYVLQACVCTMSLKARNNVPVSIITNNKIPKKYDNLFDNVIDIPWAKYDNSRYKVANRWKIYHASPYEETIVLDTDTLILQNLDLWWNFLRNYDLFFLNKVYTYRSTIIGSDYYRKAFIKNNLPNLYCGFHYFKKCDNAKEFFSWLEIVSKNWELFYGQYCKEFFPSQPSMDLSCAIVSKILNNDFKITNNKIDFLKFIHMKPYAQDWNNVEEDWQNKVGSYMTANLELYVGNYLQDGIFHYASDTFLDKNIVQKIEKFIGIE